MLRSLESIVDELFVICRYIKTERDLGWKAGRVCIVEGEIIRDYRDRG